MQFYDKQLNLWYNVSLLIFCLLSLGLNESSEDLDLLIHEFIVGRKGNLSKTQEQTMQFYRNELQRNYNWSGRIRKFNEIVTQPCSDMNIFIEYGAKFIKYDVAGEIQHCDYGLCCTIEPYLEFFNNETKVYFSFKNQYISLKINNKKTLRKDLNVGSYERRHWQNIPMVNARNGVSKGLRMLMDMEVYEYAEFHMGSTGLKLKIGPSSDKKILSFGGIYVRPGISIQTINSNQDEN